MEHKWIKFHSRYYEKFCYENEEICENCGLETFVNSNGDRMIYIEYQDHDAIVKYNEDGCVIFISCEEYIIKKIIE
jgi:hypothetical protein